MGIWHLLFSVRSESLSAENALRVVGHFVWEYGVYVCVHSHSLILHLMQHVANANAKGSDKYECMRMHYVQPGLRYC